MTLVILKNRLNVKILFLLDLIARNKLLSILLVGALSLGGCYFVSLFRGMPHPCYHDEFSYLLSADTFAHGRLTNPTHPMWQHFETFHELMRPSYMSKYPPGQGLFLAAGQVLFGLPIYGVWLSAALMCMVICWMLYGWVSARWALVGGIVAVLQFGVFTYWSQSYWGGAVAAFGGALVFGAFPRIFKYQRLRDVLWLGLGLAILANSRPLEGILLGIPIGVLVLPWRIKWDRIRTLEFVKRIVVPFITIFLLILFVTGAYNKAVTGESFLFPHIMYAKTYTSVPPLIYKPLGAEPQYNNETMSNYEQEWTKKYYLEKKTWEGFVKDFKGDIERVFMFYFGYPVAIPSLVIVFLIFWRRQRAFFFMLALMIILGTCVTMTCLAKPHYFSSLTCLVVLLVVGGLRILSLLKFRNTRIGYLLIICLLLVQLAINLMNIFTPTDLSVGRVLEATTANNLDGFLTRQDLINALLKKGGKHLVIVSYDPHHIVHFEWVYNDADIDHAPIVWARAIDAAKDAELLNYFKDRQVWHVQVGILDQYSFREFNARYIEEGWADQFDFYKPYSKSIVVLPARIESPKPVGADDYYARGVIYYRKGLIDQALVYYGRSILLDPNYVNAYYGCALIYDRKRNFNQAVAEYNKVVELKPDFVYAYYGLAGDYFYLKDYDLALADVRKIGELGFVVNPKFINALKQASGLEKPKVISPPSHRRWGWF